VLETEKRRKELQKTWLGAAEVQLGLAHRTVRWGTGQCPVRQAGPLEKAALGTRRRCMAGARLIHQTVWWFIGLSGESPAANSSFMGNRKGDVAIIHRTVRWYTRLSGEPTVGRAIRGQRVAAPMDGSWHRTVWCANWPRAATVVCARKGRRSAPDRLQ
jgi:hypothetical protein